MGAGAGPSGALAPCMRTLATTGCGAALRAELGEERVLVLADTASDRDAATAVLADGRRVASRSRTTGCHAAVIARCGRIGLDVETMARVALNVTAVDAWLAQAERATVVASADPLIELACRWVLKEAYGKALGIGLDLPLDRLAFGGRDGGIVLDGPCTIPGWDFALYRHCDRICAVACHATPFAPAGRNPPGPALDT